MKARPILQYIRQKALVQLIFPLLLFIAAAVILVNQPLYEYFFVSDISASEPLVDSVSREEHYVRTEARDLYYTGSDYYVDGVLTGHYYYQLFEDYCRIYILKPAAGKPADIYINARTVTGKIVRADLSTDALFDSMANALDWTPAGLAAVCDPYLVSEVVYFPLLSRILFILVLISVLAGLAILIYTLILLIFPGLSASCLRLRRYGDADTLLREAENELKNDVLLNTGRLVLTPHFLVEYNADRTAIIPLKAVLWIFHLRDMRYSAKEHRERMYYSLRITTITGDVFTLRDYHKNELEKIMDVLTEHYPNFFYDYSEEHERMVNYILEENEKELKEKRKNKKGAP